MPLPKSYGIAMGYPLLAGTGLPVAVTPAPSPAPTPTPSAIVYDLIIARTDSIGNNVFEAEAGDVDVANVFQWRTRAPAGISADITPLDSGTAQGNQPVTNPYSPLTSFAAAYTARTGRKVLVMLNGWNGTGYNNGFWTVGGAGHEEFITKANAAIAGAKAVDPTSKLVAIVEILGTNDSSMSKADFKAAKLAAMADVRSRVTGAGTVPYLHAGMLPENTASIVTQRRPLLDAVQEVCADNANCSFVAFRKGYNSGDYVHPANQGSRYFGTDCDAALADKTGPVVSTATAIASGDGQPLAVALTADEYATWAVDTSYAEGAQFEVFKGWASSTNGDLASVDATWTLRYAGNGTKAYNSGGGNARSVRLIVKDRSGNPTPFVTTVTVAAPYGVGDQGPVTATYVGSAAPSGNLRYASTIAAVPLKKGMNLLYFWHDGGGAIQTLKIGGTDAVRLVASTNGSQGDIWGLIAAADGNYDLPVTTNANDLNNVAITIAALTGTKASPIATAFVPGSGNPSPVTTASLTCPADAIVVGMGFLADAQDGPIAGCTRVGKNGRYFVNKRTTTGAMGENGSGYNQVSAVVFEKSV